MLTTVHNVFVPLDQFDFEADSLVVLRDGPVQWLTDHKVMEYRFSVQSKFKRVWFGFPEHTSPDVMLMFKLTWAGK